MNTVYYCPTRVQVVLAQIGEAVKFGCGYELVAVRLQDGWKYIVSWSDGQVAHVCYAHNGYEAAINALNDDDDRPNWKRPDDWTFVKLKMTYDEAYELASIRASELEGPNSPNYDSLCESILEELCIKHGIEE